ncbi:MAG: hypothetical protein ACYCQJ_14745 [Nitrososphaerales archaeon]
MLRSYPIYEVKVLTRGTNYILNGIPIHAEVDALSKLPASRRVQTVILTVIRVRQDGTLTNSCPCLHCLAAIAKMAQFGYNINQIYFSDESGAVIRRTFNQLLENTYITEWNRKNPLSREVRRLVC